MTDTPFSPSELDQALYNAISRGQYDVMNEALQSGATLGAKDAATGRGLLFAIIDRMADIPDNSDEFGQLTVMFLNYIGHAGLDPNAKDKGGISPLNYTIRRGNFLIADVLIATGADVDEKLPDGGNTPLHVAVTLAAEGKGIRLLNTLLGMSADPTLRNDAGVSAFDLVARRDDVPEIRAALSSTHQVQAFLAAERAVQQDNLRGGSKRFKLGGPGA